MATPRVLESQCEWRASDVADESTWTECLTSEELDELDAALRAALEKSNDVLEITRDDFPLPGLEKRLAAIELELINGRGFVRIRGIDRARYDQAQMEMLYWGIGTHLGLPWPQNKHGHVLGDVTDQGKAQNDPTAPGRAPLLRFSEFRAPRGLRRVQFSRFCTFRNHIFLDLRKLSWTRDVMSGCYGLL